MKKMERKVRRQVTVHTSRNDQKPVFSTYILLPFFTAVFMCAQLICSNILSFLTRNSIPQIFPSVEFKMLNIQEDSTSNSGIEQ